MKLATFFISSVFSYSPVTDVRGPDERYIYEEPLCSSVSQCSDLDGCDGKIFTGKTGEITLNGYQNHFSCRWEVRGPAGSKIKVFFRLTFDQILILSSRNSAKYPIEEISFLSKDKAFEESLHLHKKKYVVNDDS